MGIDALIARPHGPRIVCSSERLDPVGVLVSQIVALGTIVPDVVEFPTIHEPIPDSLPVALADGGATLPLPTEFGMRPPLLS